MRLTAYFQSNTEKTLIGLEMSMKISLPPSDRHHYNMDYSSMSSGIPVLMLPGRSRINQQLRRKGVMPKNGQFNGDNSIVFKIVPLSTQYQQPTMAPKKLCVVKETICSFFLQAVVGSRKRLTMISYVLIPRWT